MKKLLLMRHGNAPPSDDGDLARELDDLGKKQAAISAGFIQKNYNIDYAIVSPTQRTKKTFQIVQNILNFPEAHYEQVPQIYNNSVDDIAYAISSIHNNPDTLLVVGHNPGLLEFAICADKYNGLKFEKEIKSGLKPAQIIILSFPDIKNWEDPLDGEGEIIEIFIPQPN